MTEMPDARPLLFDVADALSVVVAKISTEQLDWPGLGEWSVRDLLGHTLRAMVTAQQYYEAGPTGEAPTLADRSDYFRTAALSDPAVQAAIAQRGRDAGAELGHDPRGSVDRALADARVVIAGADLDRVVSVANGSMRYGDYLHTRLFEMVVHTDDLCRALDLANPASDEAIRAALSVAVEAASGADLRGLLGTVMGRGAAG